MGQVHQQVGISGAISEFCLPQYSYLGWKKNRDLKNFLFFLRERNKLLHKL